MMGLPPVKIFKKPYYTRLHKPPFLIYNKFMERLRMKLKEIVDISDIEWNSIKYLFHNKSIKKKTTIQREHEIFNELYFLKSGSARSYFLDHTGKEITWQLYFNDDSSTLINLLIDDSISYYENTGTPLTFETLDDCEFSVISLSKLEELYQSDNKWQYLGRIVSHNTYFKATFERSLSLLSDPAPKRYQDLIAKHPRILNAFKSNIIASYLGIAPQTLSKIKKLNLGE
jgi:CRP-like cAMP-binding protein